MSCSYFHLVSIYKFLNVEFCLFGQVVDSGSGEHASSLCRLPSPLPDLRRDSACDEFPLMSLPVPTEFADSRRNSSVEGSSG